jgi:hypothetical protein
MITDRLITPNLLELPEDIFEDDDRSKNSESDLPLISDRDRRLVTHPYDLIIRSLKEQIDNRTLILADDFQRRRVWDDAKASRLIESLLINVPIPVCYFAELNDGSYSVIDGQQRLTSIYRYLDNQFTLKSLKIRADLNGKGFDQLGVQDRRSIESRLIRCIVILKNSDPEIKFDVFDRLNSNSVKLNRQELRNSLYKGDLSNSINRDLSENEIFKKLRRAKEVDKRMNDCELILRFFALYFDAANYQGYLPKFLDNYLRKGQELNPEQKRSYQKIFVDTVTKVEHVFNTNSFRRYDPNSQTWINSLNRAIYDVVMLYFSRLSLDVVLQKKDDILDAFMKIHQDPAFQLAITVNPEKKSSLQARLDKWHESLGTIGITVERVIIGSVSENTAK